MLSESLNILLLWPQKLLPCCNLFLNRCNFRRDHVKYEIPKLMQTEINMGFMWNLTPFGKLTLKYSLFPNQCMNISAWELLQKTKQKLFPTYVVWCLVLSYLILDQDLQFYTSSSEDLTLDTQTAVHVGQKHSIICSIRTIWQSNWADEKENTEMYSTFLILYNSDLWFTVVWQFNLCGH